METYSDLAKIRFIADSTYESYWGSNEQEQKDIELIRSEYKDYLYDDNPPKEIIDKLIPVANKLIDATPKHLLCAVGMYE